MVKYAHKMRPFPAQNRSVHIEYSKFAQNSSFDLKFSTLKTPPDAFSTINLRSSRNTTQSKSYSRILRPLWVCLSSSLCVGWVNRVLSVRIVAFCMSKIVTLIQTNHQFSHLWKISPIFQRFSLRKSRKIRKWLMTWNRKLRGFGWNLTQPMAWKKTVFSKNSPKSHTIDKCKHANR